MNLQNLNNNPSHTNPDWVETYINLGSQYEQQGKWPSAIAYYRLALRINPNLAIAHKRLGDLWYKLKRCDRAIECWYTAFNLEPRFIEEALKIYDHLGEPLLKLEQWEEVIAPSEQTLDFDHDNSLCYYHLISILSKIRGDQEILASNPSSTKLQVVENVEFYYRLGEALAKAGHLKEAIFCYRQAIALS